MKRKINIGRFLKYFVLICWALVDIYPLFWVLMSSFKDKVSVIARPLALPERFSIESYITAWVNGNIGQNFFNSLLYSFMSVMLILVCSSMAAFALTRIWKSKVIYSYFTLGIMVPVHGILIPCFIIMNSLQLYNTRVGFIVLMIAANLSLSIFVLVGFLQSVPIELDDAAKIDGCGYFRLYISILLPVVKPALATVGTLTLLNVWNEYLFAYIMLSKEGIKSITQGIFALQGRYATDYSALCAGLMIAIIPMMMFFILFQENVISGMTAGSIKG